MLCNTTQQDRSRLGLHVFMLLGRKVRDGLNRTKKRMNQPYFNRLSSQWLQVPARTTKPHRHAADALHITCAATLPPPPPPHTAPTCWTSKVAHTHTHTHTRTRAHAHAHRERESKTNKRHTPNAHTQTYCCAFHHNALVQCSNAHLCFQINSCICTACSTQTSHPSLALQLTPSEHLDLLRHAFLLLKPTAPPGVDNTAAVLGPMRSKDEEGTHNPMQRCKHSCLQ